MACVDFAQRPAGAAADRLLATYEALLVRARRMRALVREHDWDTLLEELPAYIEKVEWLSRQEVDSGMDRGQRERKARMLEDILEHDAEIRHHLARRRNELARALRSSRHQRSLSRAYGAPAGATAYPQPGDSRP